MTNHQKSTETPQMACIILAAGQGTRMRSDKAKVMHEVAGYPMITHVIKACEAIEPQKIITVLAPHMDEVRKVVEPHSCAIQEKPLGTGDATKAAMPELVGYEGDVLVVFGDTPLLTRDSLMGMLDARVQFDLDVVVSAFEPEDPTNYGRLIVDGEEPYISAIIEEADATFQQREIKLCNGGIMLFDAKQLNELLSDLKSENAQGEYYLTDSIELARKKGLTVGFAPQFEEDIRGVNNRAQLAEVDAIMQKRLTEKHMLAGVTMLDPKSVYLCADTKLGHDVIIEPHVVFGRGVDVGNNVQIRAFSHLEGAKVEQGAIIGPYARLRPQAEIGEGARIGNFVEVKKAQIKEGAKVNHLSYIGDATVGAGTNIGAGTITCNYDGYDKSRTTIGEGAFIGSNSILVAPVDVGDGAITAAGSVITKNVPTNALAVTRMPQKCHEDWAKQYRAKKEKKD